MEALTAFVLVFGDTDHMDWDGGWVVMAVGMIIFWALVLGGLFWLVRELAGRGNRLGKQPEALEILDRRLADGTLSVEEYRERRAILTGSPPSGQGPTA